MTRIKLYVSSRDVDKLDGKTFQDIVDKVMETQNYQYLHDYSFFRNLVTTGKYGPGIPPEAISFEVRPNDTIMKGRMVAVIVTINVFEYMASFYYKDVATSLSCYDHRRLAEAVITMLSDRHGWDKESVMEYSIELTSNLAVMGRYNEKVVKLDQTDVYLTVSEPSKETIFQHMKDAFNNGRYMVLLDD